MITYYELQDLCKDLGYVDNSNKANDKNIQYVKVQEWAKSRDYLYLYGEKHTVCKMKLPVVNNPIYEKYRNISIMYHMHRLSKNRLENELNKLNLRMSERGFEVAINPPQRYDYNVTKDEIIKFIEDGRKWRIVRENKQIEKILNTLK